MATAPLSQPLDPALQELLSTLDPNILPTEPSSWPLPIGYWLVLALFLLAVAALFFTLYKTKTRRQLRAEIKRISQFEPTEQTIAAHKLLRWVSIYLANQPRGLNNKQFADFVQSRYGSLPTWFNSHYANEPLIPINWQEYNTVIKQISRRSAK